jgi:RNA polymerase sigma-70 factor (ECF subfamily)
MRVGSEQADGGKMPPLRALEDVYRSNVQLVYGYAVARLGRAEGEDVTGEVFQAAALAFAEGRADHVTPPWLMAVTRNKVIDRWRRAERRMAKAHLLEQAGEVVGPLELSLDRERRDQVLDTLSKLNGRHRMLLVLHHLEGQSVQELADALGESVRAVESALARARRRFRTIYERRAAS